MIKVVSYVHTLRGSHRIPQPDHRQRRRIQPRLESCKSIERRLAEERRKHTNDKLWSEFIRDREYDFHKRVKVISVSHSICRPWDVNISNVPSIQHPSCSRLALHTSQYRRSYRSDPCHRNFPKDKNRHYRVGAKRCKEYLDHRKMLSGYRCLSQFKCQTPVEFLAAFPLTMVHIPSEFGSVVRCACIEDTLRTSQL